MMPRSKTLIVWIVLHLLSGISSIPLNDLDSEGYPKDFQVFSYACTGHYWFEGHWHNEHRRYVIDPPYSPTDRRYIQWASTNQWRCYKPDTNVFFRSCGMTKFFDCTADFAIRYQIIASQSDGWYRRNGTDTNNNNYYHSESVPRRVIYFDTNASEWHISDEYNGNVIYATCHTLSFFECEWVHTGRTATPTYNPTESPTIGTTSPTEAPFKAVTKQPTPRPTLNPTKTPSRRPTLQAQIITIKPSTSAMISSYFSTVFANTKNETIDLNEETRDSSQLLVYVMISAVCCCVFCVVCAMFYKSKMDIKAIKAKDDEVKVASLIMNARPVVPLPPLRDRVYSNSQAQHNADDDEITSRNRAITDPGMQIDERVTERIEKQRDEFKKWVTEIVKLPEYYDVLVQNGFESLGIIKEVKDQNELAEIGIDLKGHRLKIMREIERLE
eukprot:49858_1